MLINSTLVNQRLSRFHSQLLALFVSVAIFLSISTNLRITGIPIGLGEIFLALLIAGCAFLKPWHQIKNGLFLFWVAVWFCMTLGFAFGNVTGALRLHNTLAYGYTGFLTLAFLAIFNQLDETDLRRVLLYFIVISTIALWVGFIIYLNFDQTTLANLRIDTSDHGRYQGWCQNANQMSLMLVPTPFLISYLWSTSHRTRLNSIGWLTLLLLSVLMGLMVRSDALGFSWILGIGILGILYILKRDCIGAKHLAVLLAVFIVGFLSVRFAAQQGWLGESAHGQLYAQEAVIEKLRIGHGETQQKVNVRVQLWKNALHVWEESPVVGHGPGAYSFFKLSETESLTGMEAHNTLIDLMVQGGLLLGAAYLLLFGWLMITLWRSGQWLLLTSTLVIFSFEFFMFHIRQPVIWFYLTLVLALARFKTKYAK